MQSRSGFLRSVRYYLATTENLYFLLVAFVIAFLIAFPILSLLVIAVLGEFSSLVYILGNLIPPAAFTTLVLMFGVAILTATVGSILAWAVTFFEFPGRRVFAWLVVLPLAIPPYIAAYTFTEFLEFTGPVQSAIRDLWGFSSSRDYWFPPVRSMFGAIIVISFVLYPYVYLAVRSLFLLQGSKSVEAARVLGAGQFRIFFKVLLPMARPAVAIGVMLALMETLNDIGAVEHLGVQTLTLSVFAIWLNQDNLAGAAQISLILLAIAFLLVYAERKARKDRAFHENGGSGTVDTLFRVQPTKTGKLALSLTCLVPTLIGFGIPLYVLGGFTFRFFYFLLDPGLLDALVTTATLATVGGLITIICAILLAYTLRIAKSPAAHLIVRFSCLGYAIPGTIVALGIFLPLAAFDNFMNTALTNRFGLHWGLLLTGTGFTLIYAYTVRFMAMAEGVVEGGMKKLSPNLDMAARSLGRSPGRILREVHMILLRPVVAVGFLLVFIEITKELSATILLRPFGLNTLSTYVYELASRALVEEAGLASLIIVLLGTIPVILVSKLTMKDI